MEVTDMMEPNALYGNFIHEISIMLDEQKSIPFEETKKRIEDKSVIPWLKQTLPGFDRIQLLNQENTEFLHEQLENILTCKPSRYDGCWGTGNNGLCLILSATAELIDVE
jgi:hypothetical protein